MVTPEHCSAGVLIQDIGIEQPFKKAEKKETVVENSGLEDVF